MSVCVCVCVCVYVCVCLCVCDVQGNIRNTIYINAEYYRISFLTLTNSVFRGCTLAFRGKQIVQRKLDGES